MKKVVICVPSLAIGGAERFAVDLALALDKNKFRVIIAITRLMWTPILANFSNKMMFRLLIWQEKII